MRFCSEAQVERFCQNVPSFERAIPGIDETTAYNDRAALADVKTVPRRFRDRDATG